MSLDIDNENNGSEGKLTFLDGALDLNKALDDILKEAGVTGSPFQKLPDLLFTEFDLTNSYDHGAKGSGLAFEAIGEMDGVSFTVCYGTYSAISGKGKTPQSFSIKPHPFVVESLPIVNLKLDPPVILDLQEAGVVTEDYLDKNGEKVSKGIFIRGTLMAEGGEKKEVKIVYPRNPEPDPADAPNAPKPVAKALPTPVKKQGQIKWFDVNKTLGSARLRQVGVQWEDSKIWALLNADISFGGIKLDLMGLKAGIPASIPPEKPSFGLDGLGLSFDNGGVEIGGSFLKVPASVTGITNQYDGAVEIKFEELKISGMGSYAKINGHDSIFVYTFVDYPIGGPAFFFVEGLALAFGYNRQFIPPPIDQVEKFPLVQQAISGKVPDKSSDPMAMLQQLDQYLPPKEGNLLLGVGVKFNTFKVVDSFLLLLASFGDETRFDLIGISQLSLPPDAKGDPTVFVEIALKASLEPERGDVKVDGLITSHSYVYSKDAHLMGSFAFYSWFKDQTDTSTGASIKAGDFVMSMGGYHPDFVKPDHYPTVPRIALNWRVNENLDAKGDAYFAMTPRYAMAGFGIKATYHDGALKADFSAGADFLIQWKPFHYDIKAYVNIRASYRISINLLFTTIHKTLHLDVGAQLHIWGPAFSGHAKIHVKVLGIGISVGLSFGAGAGTPAALDWSGFSSSFLPAKEKVISFVAVGGLIKTIGKTWVFNRSDLCIQVNTALPLTGVEESNIAISPKSTTDLFVNYPVAPMQLEAGELTSEFILTLTKNGVDQGQDLVYIPTQKEMPLALWGDYKKRQDLNASSLRKLANGVELRLAQAPKSGPSKPVMADALAYDTKVNPPSNHWSDSDKPEGDFVYDKDLLITYLSAYQLKDFLQLTITLEELQSSQVFLDTPIAVNLF